MWITLHHFAHFSLSFSKFCSIQTSDITSDIISDIISDIHHLHKLSAFYRHLYAPTEILHSWHWYTSLLKTFTYLLETTSPSVDKPCLKHCTGDISITWFGGMLAVEHLFIISTW